eukprot:jgi/Mesvir1/28187/Mv04744-RA.1
MQARGALHTAWSGPIYPRGVYTSSPSHPNADIRLTNAIEHAKRTKEVKFTVVGCYPLDVAPANRKAFQEPGPFRLATPRLGVSRGRNVFRGNARKQNLDPAELEKQALIADFVCTSPILTPAGITPSEVRREIFSWDRLATTLAQALGYPAGFQQQSPSQRARIYHLYLPLYMWCQRQLWAHRLVYARGADARGGAASGGSSGGSGGGSAAQTGSTGPDGSSGRVEDEVDAGPPPLVVGLNATHGSGGTTLVEQLVGLFKSSRCRAVGLSMDDFFVPADEQASVASKWQYNPLLEMSGNPGTHDLALAAETLACLRKLTKRGMTARIPTYDKSLRGGKGDRRPVEEWRVVEGPIDILFVEGWLLGMSPLPDDTVKKMDRQLVPVNQCLRDYASVWDAAIDVWIVMCIGDPLWIYRWEVQAEASQRELTGQGKTDEQVVNSLSRFMAAYRAYLPALYTKGPESARPGKLLQVNINEDREPI